MGMVARMVGPNRVSASVLAKESGIPQPTLSRWLRGAATVPVVDEKNDESKAPALQQKRAAEWSAEAKLRVVIEASKLDDSQLGAFLRREGLHEAQLADWRAAVLASLQAGPKRPRAQQSKRIQQLERELHRKDKALAETAALLVLQGKVRALWGEEGVDTRPRSGK